jgi:hypothetical protein
MTWWSVQEETATFSIERRRLPKESSNNDVALLLRYLMAKYRQKLCAIRPTMLFVTSANVEDAPAVI